MTLGDCSTKIGAHVTNTAGSVNVPPLFTTGAINTAAMTSSNTSQSSSQVQQLSGLAGLIAADNITAASSTTDQSGTLQVSAAGSSFTNLVVAGDKIQGTPAPNTKIDLAGLGYVILNEEITTTKGSTAKLVVNMIHVFVTEDNTLKIPKGAQIIVANATSDIEIAENASLDGFAYGTKARVTHTILSGTERSGSNALPWHRWCCSAEHDSGSKRTEDSEDWDRERYGAGYCLSQLQHRRNHVDGEWVEPGEWTFNGKSD